uniref:Carbohydrate ABC transporter permease n=1 Tax=Thermofilum pendens TaxID=2269 RepID=A0A7C1NXI9_THEPE
MDGILKKIAEPSLTVIGYVILLVLLAYVLTPLIWLFITAFNPKGGPYLEIPREVTLDNFVRVFAGETPKEGARTAARSIYIARWVINSFVIAFATMIITVALSAPAGYALSRLQFRGKELLMTAILVMGMMPTTSKMLPLFRLAAFLGFIDNLLGVALVIASGTIPTQIWILKGFFDHIPREIEEQAWICGCSYLSTLFRVVLPAAGPGLLVVAFLSFLSGWGNFIVPLILIYSEPLYPISLGLASVFVHNPGEIGLAIDYGVACALSVIYAIPPILVYYVFREHLMEIKLGKVEIR